MATMETIAADIIQIDAKKESLKKAFDDLQAYSSLLSPSFSLSWSDLDRYFSSLQSSLSHRLRLLESLHPSSKPAEQINSGADGEAEAPVAWPELSSLCEKMNGKGLVQYLMVHSGDEDAMKRELSSAIRCASDPAEMVLDAVEGFIAESSGSGKSAGVRRVLDLLLGSLMEIDTNLSFDARERAKRVASDWKQMIGFVARDAAQALGFLHFIAAYELGSEFNAEELVDYLFLISRYKQATFLCKKIGLGDKVADLIQKLLDSGKVHLSIKFIFEFHMTDKFEPVAILKSYLEDSRKDAQKIGKKGKNSLKAQNQAFDKEINALKAVIKVIKEHKLESEFSQENLEKRRKYLEKEIAERRSNANPTRQLQRQRGKKRQRSNPHNGSNSTVPLQPQQPSQPRPQPQPQPRPQPQPQPRPVLLTRPEGVLPGHPGPFQSNPYGLPNSNLGVVPYVDLLPGLYSSAATLAGYSGSAGTANSQLYPSQRNVNPVYYSGQTGSGGYNLPTQYHPAHNPQ